MIAPMEKKNPRYIRKFSSFKEYIYFNKEIKVTSSQIFF